LDTGYGLDERFMTLWAAYASEALQALPAEKAALLERRLDAAARAAEELPPSATAEEIFDRGSEIERLLS
jgi:hypothetical protein